MEQTKDAPAELKRRSRSRTALVEAAKRLLSKSSISGFTIDDVAREADVARGTFYNHFTSLDALVALTVATTQDDLLECVRNATERRADMATQIACGVVTSFLYCYRNPASALVLVHNPSGAADPRSLRNTLLVSSLRRGLSQGEFKFTSLDAAFTAVLGCCQLGTLRMLEVIHEYSEVRELVHAMCVMVLRCLGVDARRIEKLSRDAVVECFDKPLGRHK